MKKFDGIMLEMNGRELSIKIAPIIPEIKIVFTSGYTADSIADHVVLETAGLNFIQKPFTLQDIADGLKKAMET